MGEVGRGPGAIVRALHTRLFTFKLFRLVVVSSPEWGRPGGGRRGRDRIMINLLQAFIIE